MAFGTRSPVVRVRFRFTVDPMATPRGALRLLGLLAVVPRAWCITKADESNTEPHRRGEQRPRQTRSPLLCTAHHPSPHYGPVGCLPMRSPPTRPPLHAAGQTYPRRLSGGPFPTSLPISGTTEIAAGGEGYTGTLYVPIVTLTALIPSLRRAPLPLSRYSDPLPLLPPPPSRAAPPPLAAPGPPRSARLLNSPVC